MEKRKLRIILGSVVAVVLIVGVAVTIYLTQRAQDVRSRADEPLICEAPLPPTNVTVNFPDCTGATCNLTKGNCTWEVTPEATASSVTIFEVETGDIVKEATVSAGVNKLVFDVEESNTYRCTVSTVNACGVSSSSASHELFCEVDAMVVSITPSPTLSPTSTIRPTNTPVPTVPPTAVPTILPSNTPVPTAQPTVVVMTQPTAVPTVLPTAIPTSLPTATIAIPTSTPIPATPTQIPTIVPSGGVGQSIGIIGLALIFIIGGLMLVVL